MNVGLDVHMNHIMYIRIDIGNQRRNAFYTTELMLQSIVTTGDRQCTIILTQA